MSQRVANVTFATRPLIWVVGIKLLTICLSRPTNPVWQQHDGGTDPRFRMSTFNRATARSSTTRTTSDTSKRIQLSDELNTSSFVRKDEHRTHRMPAPNVVAIVSTGYRAPQ
jgi:hypothetical protein